MGRQMKVENGNYVLSEEGIPQEIWGREELLQDAAFALTVPLGSFPYHRGLGSLLGSLTGEEEHYEDLARSYAGQALLDLPGVEVESVTRQQDDSLLFGVNTPLGRGSIRYSAEEGAQVVEDNDTDF